MPGTEFQATVRPGAKGSRVELSGTVNRGAKEEMERAYEEASTAQGEILLDFDEVDYINSTGIAVIVGVLAMARAENREVGATGLTEHYKEVFEITRLADFMHIYADSSAGN
jgi:anti-sigma B factor antagonist